ncbi:MAG: hypothetical protein Q9227_003291 [Pyrenula ochraceoflavens]
MSVARDSPHSSKLEDQAATAALYVTHPERAAARQHPLLDETGKLSSAGAATSLKYANPTDLPSYPSAGLKLSSASAAASLADANKSHFEYWKPPALPDASKAANLAKNYQAEPAWKPEMTSAGSKAALLAHRDAGKVEVWQAQQSDAGLSAAGQAVRKQSQSPAVDRSVPADANRRALLAATGAMSGNRRRADSAPMQPPPGSKSPNLSALRAATQSHKTHRAKTPSLDEGNRTLEAGRVHDIAKNKVAREMYSSHPPVSIESEEKKKQETMRASAVAMAQKMYAIQQNAIDEAKGVQRSQSHHAANAVHNRRTSVSSFNSDDMPLSPRYTNLEDAARKLAQERLAKLNDESQDYRSYYGAASPSRSRLSIRGKLRRRASSDGQLDKVDEEQSHKIRSQMSLFQNKLAEVDSQKRQKDRDALLVAAQRNVTASMNTMDKRVFDETGKASPAMMQEWENKARERAQASSEARMKNYGKVHIGGGKYLDQSDVDAVAQSRIQPTLDDINDKAEARRAKEEEQRLEQEEKNRQEQTEKHRAAELKVEQKRLKAEEKEEEKRRKAEEKQAQKEGKRKSHDGKSRGLGAALGLGSHKAGGDVEKTEGQDSAPTTATEPTTTSSTAVADEEPETSETTGAAIPETVPHQAAVAEEDEMPTSPEKGDSKVKSWLKSRFRRSTNAGSTEEKSFVGGAALGGHTASDGQSSEKPRDNSMREVAMAGKSEPEDMYGASDREAVSPPDEKAETEALGPEPSISSMSSSDEEEHSGEQGSSRGRRGFKERFLQKALGKTTTQESASTNRDSEFEEARDTFDEGASLAPPPKLTTVMSGGQGKPTSSPVRDSRFSEEFDD